MMTLIPQNPPKERYFGQSLYQSIRIRNRLKWWYMCVGNAIGTPRDARIFDKMDIINIITKTYSCSIKAVDTRYGNIIFSTGFHCARFQQCVTCPPHYPLSAWSLSLKFQILYHLRFWIFHSYPRRRFTCRWSVQKIAWDCWENRYWISHRFLLVFLYVWCSAELIAIYI